MQFTFSAIQPEEVPFVFSLAQDFAAELGLTDKHKMTLERMHQELFGKKADWNALVIKKEDLEIIGFCFYSIVNINHAFHNSPLLQVDDLYIKPEYRRHGLGEKILKVIAQIAKEKGILRIEMWCGKNNLIEQSFYQKHNALKIDYLDVFRFYVKDL
jgi:ribosomal protein S18 acetylase RimI-like enzyme